MIRAFIAGLILAVIAPSIGIFLVVRRYSLLADSLAHVSLLGVSIGLISGVNPIITAIATSALASLGMEKLREGKKVFGESVLALFLSGSLAIAVVIISLAKGFNVNLFTVLFGSIATVSWTDVIIMIVLGLSVGVIIILLFQRLVFISFDEDIAQASGIRVKTYNILLIILAAVIVSLSMRIVGVLLIGALMVIPVISATLFHRGFKATMLIAMLFSFTAVLSGLILSFYLNLASGGTIVMMTLLIFLVSLFLARDSRSS